MPSPTAAAGRFRAAAAAPTESRRPFRSPAADDCAIHLRLDGVPPLMNATSHRSRRLLVRLERGSDLLRAIGEACSAAKVRSGQLQACGWLEEIELTDYDPAARALRPPRRLQ